MRRGADRSALVPLLVVGDLVALLGFSALGMASHGEPMTWANLVRISLPFVATWFLLGLAVGAFGPSVADLWRMWLRTVLAWVPAGVLAILLRALLLGRVPAPTFWLLTLATVALFLLVVRTVLLLALRARSGR